jgi:hypothetical protein
MHVGVTGGCRVAQILMNVLCEAGCRQQCMRAELPLVTRRLHKTASYLSRFLDFYTEQLLRDRGYTKQGCHISSWLDDIRSTWHIDLEAPHFGCLSGTLPGVLHSMRKYAMPASHLAGQQMSGVLFSVIVKHFGAGTDTDRDFPPPCKDYVCQMSSQPII